MAGALRKFLTKRRSQYRVMSVALGIAFIAVGLLFGLERQFSNWAVVSVLIGAGTILAVVGLLIPERYLAAFFTFCLIVNVLAAAYALLFPHPAH
jgi:hypothetical protein